MFERCYTVGIQNGVGPIVETQELYKPDGPNRLKLAAWQSGGSGFNAHIFRGSLSLLEAQDRLAGGFVDCLMTVPQGGIAWRELPDDVGEITILFEAANASNELQAVTFRVHG